MLTTAICCCVLHAEPGVGAITQLTFPDQFHKAGESYISPDGGKVIFQAVPKPPRGQSPSEHYDMYVADLVAGDDPLFTLANIRRLNAAGSANTCGWFHPIDHGLVLYASTIGPPVAQDTPGYQRESGKYRWAFPPSMRIVKQRIDVANAPPEPLLGDDVSYQAECSWSPDGRHVLYTDLATGDGDIYVHDLVTGATVVLVDAPGYDGGPFFSPDGKRITWRGDRRSDDLLQLLLSMAAGDLRTACAAACVCARWRRLLRGGAALHRIVLTEYSNELAQGSLSLPALLSLPLGGPRALSFSQLGVLRDNALQEALPRCSRLRALDLSLCPSLSAAAGSIVASHCQQLVELDLSGLTAIDDVSLADVAAHCASLRAICLNGCTGVGDAGVSALAAGCVGLSAVHAFGCTRLGEEGALALARGCAALATLDVTGSSACSDAVLLALAEALQRQSTALRVAVFAGCPNVPLCHLHVGSPHRFGADAHLFIGGDGRGTFDPGSRPQPPKPRGYEQTPPSPPVMPPSPWRSGMPRPGSSGTMAALPASIAELDDEASPPPSPY